MGIPQSRCRSARFSHQRPQTQYTYTSHKCACVKGGSRLLGLLWRGACAKKTIRKFGSHPERRDGAPTLFYDPTQLIGRHLSFELELVEVALAIDV